MTETLDEFRYEVLYSVARAGATPHQAFASMQNAASGGRGV